MKILTRIERESEILVIADQLVVIGSIEPRAHVKLTHPDVVLIVNSIECGAKVIFDNAGKFCVNVLNAGVRIIIEGGRDAEVYGIINQYRADEGAGVPASIVSKSGAKFNVKQCHGAVLLSGVTESSDVLKHVMSDAFLSIIQHINAIDRQRVNGIAVDYVALQQSFEEYAYNFNELFKIDSAELEKKAAPQFDSVRQLYDSIFQVRSPERLFSLDPFAELLRERNDTDGSSPARAGYSPRFMSSSARPSDEQVIQTDPIKPKKK